MAIHVSTKENTIKKIFGDRFTITLDFYFFQHPVYPYEFKEDFIVWLKSTHYENVNDR